MGLPRSKYVKDGQEGVYHCFSRCVRRAFLYGYDPLTNRDFSHRKVWLVDRLRYLAAVFAIEVCAYAILENHYHTILRTRPDIVASWTDWEVATRWLTLFPQHRSPRNVTSPPTEQQIRALASHPQRIAQLRKRLCSLSWFMGRLNEFIARAANKEDNVKGRFWESRFKCQTLLDDIAIVSCMVYVDLNPIRAGLASTPEQSNFTSIQERILAWQLSTMDSLSSQAPLNTPSDSASMQMLIPENRVQMSDPTPERAAPMDYSLENKDFPPYWLCPISSDSQKRGILQMTTAEYFDLVDKSGRILRADKPGIIDANLAPILMRIGANPAAWPETVSRFGSKFRLAAGLAANLTNLAHSLGQRWLVGISAARNAFALSPP